MESNPFASFGWLLSWLILLLSSVLLCVDGWSARVWSYCDGVYVYVWRIYKMLYVPFYSIQVEMCDMLLAKCLSVMERTEHAYTLRPYPMSHSEMCITCTYISYIHLHK